MTDLLSRATSPAPGAAADETPPPGWLVGLVAGLAMAAAGVVAAMGLAVVGWLAGNGGSLPAALRVGADVWLLGHGSGLRLDGVSLDVVPLGVTAVVGWFAVAGGAWATRASGGSRPIDTTTVATTYAVAYAGGVFLTALLASRPSAEVGLVRALVISATIGGVGAGLGAWREGAGTGALGSRMPDWLRAGARGSLGAALALLGCSAVVLVVSLIVHVDQLRELLVALDAGYVGGGLLVIGCLTVLPNAVLFGTAVLLGPGVSIGTDTSVTLTEVSVGPLPTVPWFAAVPADGPQPVALSALAALPLLCGVVGGALAVRGHPTFGYDWAAVLGGLSGVGGGLLIGGLVAVSGGTIGPGRMADVGPDAWACVGVAVAALGVGGVIGGVTARVLAGRAA